MKPKTLVLMGVAIACGLGASYMTSRLLAERGGDDDPKVTVLVAKKNLNMGDTIRAPEELFQEKKFTRGDEPKDAIESYDQLKNRILKRPLRVGDHVTPDDMFGDKDDGQSLAIRIPKGHRATGVRVNAELSASGWATLPLSRVDLVSVVRSAADKTTYSQILLENVLVLAADTEIVRKEDGKPANTQVVTLALKPEEVLKVTLARSLGEISLALRQIHDRDKVEASKLTAEALKSGTGATNGEEQPETVTNTKPETTPMPATTAPVAQQKPETTPPQVEPKPAWERFITSTTEGGQTRYHVYWINEAGEVVRQPQVQAEEQHPPRPGDNRPTEAKPSETTDSKK